MIDTTSIAQTGLFAAQHRWAQAADNVAAVSAAGFEARRVSPQDAAAPAPADQGPAAVTGTPETAHAAIPAIPATPQDDAASFESTPDVVSEHTEQLGAFQAFRANLATAGAANEHGASLLDIMA